jgi:hypothetical protein
MPRFVDRLDQCRKVLGTAVQQRQQIPAQKPCRHGASRNERKRIWVSPSGPPGELLAQTHPGDSAQTAFARSGQAAANGCPI